MPPTPPVSLPVPRTGEITFYLSLPVSAAGLDQAAAKVATPGSSTYRHFSSLAAAAGQFGATDAQIDAIAQSVRSLGLQFAADPTRLFGRVTGSAKQWQAALGTPLTEHAATASNPFTSYSLPAKTPAALQPSGTVLLMAVCAPLAGRMVARRGTRMPLLIAGAGLIAAGVLLTALTASTSAGYLIVSYLVFGIGMGMVNAPITNSAVSGMPREQAGVAAGIASASRQVGQMLGVAVMGSVLTANLHGPLPSGFAAATRPGWWIIAACGAAVIVLALITTGRRGKASAAKTASLVATAEEAAEKVPAASR